MQLGSKIIPVYQLAAAAVKVATTRKPAAVQIGHV